MATATAQPRPQRLAGARAQEPLLAAMQSTLLERQEAAHLLHHARWPAPHPRQPVRVLRIRRQRVRKRRGRLRQAPGLRRQPSSSGGCERWVVDEAFTHPVLAAPRCDGLAGKLPAWIEGTQERGVRHSTALDPESEGGEPKQPALRTSLPLPPPAGPAPTAAPPGPPSCPRCQARAVQCAPSAERHRLRHHR